MMPERRACARMWAEAGRYTFVDYALLGGLDDHPAFPLIRGLMEYRADFERRETLNDPMSNRDAMLAAADYLDQRLPPLGPGKIGSAFTESLRHGFLYDHDLIGRAFVYCHKLLARAADHRSKSDAS